MFNDEILKHNNSEFDIFEGMTSVSAVINSINNGSSNRKVLKVLYDQDNSKKKFRELGYLKAMGLKMDFSVESTNNEYISKLTSGTSHGGIIAICTKRSLPPLEASGIIQNGCYFLLDGIEDPYNFGYSVRSIFASGADGIIVPPRNWLEFAGTVARSAAGTSELANIFVSDNTEALKIFKNLGYRILCASIRDSVSIYEADFSGPLLIVVGGEKRGISRKLLDLSDGCIRIDYGNPFNGSLPTSSAVSVIAFEILRQRK